MEPAPVQAIALIDTGADLTAIPESIVRRGAIDVRGYRWVRGYDGTERKRHPCCRVRLLAAEGGPKIHLSNAIVIADPADEEPMILLGRDALSQCLLRYDGFRGWFDLAVVGL